MADAPFDFPELRIRQPGKLLADRASYRIFDSGRHLVAVASETEGRSRNPVSKPVSFQRVLAVTTASGLPVLTLVNRGADFMTDLTDPDGRLTGRIRTGGTRRIYTLLDAQDQKVGEAVGDLAVKNFSVTGPEGTRFAEIRKTWAGLRKELLTSADHYMVRFTGPVSPAVRTLTVMVPIVLDLARYESD